MQSRGLIHAAVSVSPVVLSFLLFIVWSPDNGAIPVSISTSEQLVRIRVIDISARATLFPDFNIIIEAVSNDFVLPKNWAGNEE